MARDPERRAYKASLARAHSALLSVPERVKYSEDEARDPEGRWSADGGDGASAGPKLDHLTSEQVDRAVARISAAANVFRASGGTIGRASEEDITKAMVSYGELAKAGVINRADYGPRFLLSALQGRQVELSPGSGRGERSVTNIAYTKYGDVAGAHGFLETKSDIGAKPGEGLRSTLGFGVIGTLGTVYGTGAALVGQYIKDAAASDSAIVIKPVEAAKGFWTKMGMQPFGATGYWGMGPNDAKAIAAKLK